MKTINEPHAGALGAGKRRLFCAGLLAQVSLRVINFQEIPRHHLDFFRKCRQIHSCGVFNRPLFYSGDSSRIIGRLGQRLPGRMFNLNPGPGHLFFRRAWFRGNDGITQVGQVVQSSFHADDNPRGGTDGCRASGEQDQGIDFHKGRDGIVREINRVEPSSGGEPRTRQLGCSAPERLWGPVSPRGGLTMS